MEVVGALMWLTLTRPDLLYAVNNASSFMSNHGEQHWANVCRILRYVASTLDKGITYTQPDGRTLPFFFCVLVENGWWLSSCLMVVRPSASAQGAATQAPCAELSLSMVSWLV